MLAFAVVALGINVLANYFLIPIFGLVAPAYTTVVAGTVYVILSLAATWGLRRHLWKPSQPGTDHLTQ